MGRMLVWVVIVIVLVLGAIWLSGRATHAPQSRIETPVTTGNAS